MVCDLIAQRSMILSIPAWAREDLMGLVAEEPRTSFMIWSKAVMPSALVNTMMSQVGWLTLWTVDGSAGLLAGPELGNTKLKVPVQVQGEVGSPLGQWMGAGLLVGPKVGNAKLKIPTQVQGGCHQKFQGKLG